MKLNVLICIVISLIFFTSCKGNKKKVIIKNEIINILNAYYFDYQIIKNKDDVEDFNNYLNVNYSDIEYLGKDNFELSLKDDSLLIKLKNEFSFSISINLITDLGVPDWCQNDIAYNGFFSLNFEEVDQLYFLEILHQKLSTKYNLGVPLFNKIDPFSKERLRLVYMFKSGKLKLYCSTYEMKDNDLFNKLARDIRELIEEQKEKKFDYALIPIEVF